VDTTDGTGKWMKRRGRRNDDDDDDDDDDNNADGVVIFVDGVDDRRGRGGIGGVGGVAVGRRRMKRMDIDDLLRGESVEF
jgi:hypothetical protein